MHSRNPPLLIFTNRNFRGGGQSIALIQQMLNLGNQLHLLQVESPVGTITGYDSIRRGNKSPGFPITDLLQSSTGELSSVADAVGLNVIECHLKSSSKILLRAE
ncbi:hypothetical protein DESC_40104 [Desulfosarcina cetonica]|nr:hypothetical protein DESC_40104 [Desulfosarcina cetonica]